MFAVQYKEYGGPEVLTIREVPEPHAGPGEVRVAMRAASVNPIDWMARSGRFVGEPGFEPPTIPGYDGAGIVDEVGPGVDGVAVGDEVFGLGAATHAEYAIFDFVTPKPPSLSWVEAAALGVAVETAARALDLLGVRAGATVLIDGAAGGVGSAGVQLAVARGATVIGTASEVNHDLLRALGAIPTTYGDGLPHRVAALVPAGVDGALDTPGKGSVPTLIQIVGDPRQVVSIADATAVEHGARVAGGDDDRATYALEAVGHLHTAGRFAITIERTFALAASGEAHRLSQAGHVRGKVVLTIP